MTKWITRGAPIASAAALALLVACSGDQISINDPGSTSAGPTVELLATNSSAGTVAVETPLALRVSSTGTRAIRRIIVNVMDGTRKLGGIDTAFVTPIAAPELNISVPLTNVGDGTPLTITALSRDVLNRDGVDTLRLTALVSNPSGSNGGASPGPKVRIIAPADTMRLWAGRSVRVQISAADTDGVLFVSDTLRGYGFTPIVYSHQFSPSTISDSIVQEHIIDVPATATLDSAVTLIAVAIDARGLASIPVSRRFTIRTQPADSMPPLVYQRVPARLEDSSTIVVRAEDESPIRLMGYVLRDSAGNTIFRDSLIRIGGRRTIDSAVFTVRFPQQYRGQIASIVSFANDTVAISQRSNRGYSVPDGTFRAAGADSLASRAHPLLVFGRTIPFAAGSLGADIAVDTAAARHVVYVSNLAKNRLEAIDYATLTPLAPISVGSEPWGLSVDPTTGQMLVGNSGGTNISIVSLATRTETGRYKTPNTRIWEVTENVNDKGVVRYSVKFYDYSDRPQHIAQSAGGYIYYSTRPTATAPEGTIRRFKPGLERDLQQMWQYGAAAQKATYSIINADGVTLVPALSDSKSDILTVCDHLSGQAAACTVAVSDSNVVRALATLGTDAVAAPVDAKSLGLTDTTFVAVGGDRNWVAFGEGHTGGAPGRVMMMSDTTIAGVETLRTSPGMSVGDLTDNASERVFGLAVNNNSSSVAVQGSDAFYADIATDYRFQLRLQGAYVTPGTGHGIAFHPLNDGTISSAAPNNRASFVAGGDQPTVDVVDSYYYRLRGQLPIRTTLYGPLRAVLPSAAEQAQGIAVKLFGLSPEGLVVIDVRAADLDNSPAFLRAAGLRTR